MAVIWWGEPGHFMSARKCCWHLCTDIHGKFRVSSVGCYHPGIHDIRERTLENRGEVGAGRLYETMVFSSQNNEQLRSGSLVDQPCL